MPLVASLPSTVSRYPLVSQVPAYPVILPLVLLTNQLFQRHILDDPQPAIQRLELNIPRLQPSFVLS